MGNGTVRGGRPAALRRDAVVRALPELVGTHLELVPTDVRPEPAAIDRAVWRPRDARSQHVSCSQLQLIGLVVGAALSGGGPHQSPALGLAEAAMVLATGCGEAHRPSPRTQPVRSASELSDTKCTSGQCRAWFGANLSRSTQSCAYSRKATRNSSVASSRSAPSAAWTNSFQSGACRRELHAHRAAPPPQVGPPPLALGW